MDKKSRDKSTRSRKDLSNTLDLYNVDFAKKAVGNLFDKEDDEDIIEEEEPDFSPPPKRRPVRGFDDDADIPARGVRKVRPVIRDEPKEVLDTPLPDDDLEEDELEEPKLARAKPPLQKPQVSSAIPGAQRRPRLSRIAEEEEEEEEAPEVSQNTSPGRPRARPAGSRYVFVEDEDRFSSFRRKPDILEKEEPKLKSAKDKDEAPGSGKTGGFGLRKPARELKKDRPLFDGGYVEPGSPDIIKIASMGVAGVALVIIIILLITNGSLRNRLDEAEVLQAENTGLRDELNLIRIELEGAVESLSNAQLQLQQQQEQEDLMLMELPEYEGEDAGSMALADAVRTHIVVSGDSLSRIANTFFGDSSQANIQRIMEANNITNPNNIHVGQVLDIPN